MKFMLFLLLITVLVGMALAEDSLTCYKNSMVDAILRIDDRGYVFENYAKWADEGNDRDLLNRNFKWAVRDGYNVILNDAEFLEKVGQEKAAERMREVYRKDRNRGTLRMYVGLPLGLAMSATGIYWLKHNMDIEDPSTLDQAGAVVIGVTGIGVSIGSIISFITTRKIDPYDHEMTRRQTLDMIERHNNASSSRCRE